MSRRRILSLLLLSTVCATVIGLAPVHATGVMRCDIAATVTLTNNENLLQVNGGSGTISGSFVCSGTTAGAALSSPGSFYFCQHTPTGHNPACVNPEDPSTEDLADAASSVAPIVTDIQGTINVSLNTGINCSLTLNGHSYGIYADLVLNHYKCSDGLGGTAGAEIARAEATAAIIIDPTISCTPGPGGAQACFRQLAFIGQLVAIDE